MSAHSHIAVVPGDGIGVDVTAEALKVLAAASDASGRAVTFQTFPWGADHYLRTHRASDASA